MKLSKVLFGSAVALSLVFGFASCSDEEDEKGILDISGTKCSVNFTNESATEYARAFKTLKLDRETATVKVTYDMAASKANSGKQIGVMGFIFDEQKEKVTDADIAEGAPADLKDKEYYNFSIAGFSPKGDAQRYYVSRFKAVNPSTLDKGQKFYDLMGQDAESPIDPSSELANLSEISKTTDNKLITWMTWAVEDNGHMTINYYKDSDIENNKVKTGATAIYTVDVDETSLLDKEAKRAKAANETPKTTGLKDDVSIGFYANVYGSATLVATMEMFDLTGNAVAIEE